MKQLVVDLLPLAARFTPGSTGTLSTQQQQLAMSDQPSITKLVFQRNASSIGIGQSRPTLSWRYAQTTDTVPSWKQLAYEVKIARLDREPTVYQIESSENVELDWPKAEADLASRERVKVSVRALGQNAANLAKGWTDWYTDTVEAALLSPSDWTAQVVGPKSVSSLNLPKRPFHLRKTFSVSATADIHLQPVRVYATALGVYQLYLNGQRIGDHVLAPGWQSYAHRLHYQTYTLPAAALHEGDNTLEAIVGEGWFAGRLSIGPQWRNLWGPEIGVMVQLEIAGQVVAKSDETWEWRYGSIIAAELYDGEVYDVALSDSSDWRSTKTLLLPPATSLIPPEAPPIRQMESLKPVSLLTTPSGKKILDFGQNLVGWVKVLDIPRKCSHDDIIQLRFAEVLDNGELGVRPLRTAKCTDTIYLSPAEGTAQWEPTFTTHGFRYCEVTSPALMLDNWASHFEAVVVHSDVERLGDFECSHEMINQLHRNVVWSARGNIVGLPTDCPQRDERLGWTGDIMLFAPTANYLYDMSGFLANWLHDLSEEQLKDNHNVPPMVVPNCLIYHNVPKPFPQAAWGDVCVLTPEALYNAYGSKIILREMWPSITAWLDKGIPRGENGLWADGNGAFQFGDWLDPRAPPNSPQTAMTDPYLVADAYLVATVQAASRIAYRLGFTTDGDRYETEHRRLRQVFQDQYISPRGRMASDSQAAYCLAYQFSLLEDTQLQGASERLLRLVTKGEFKIATGFVGTPALTHALLEAGHLNVAYRMLQEKGCPSWLYPLTKGATTVWERWDSIMEDDSINPGEMTSFNHYSLGAVANFLHTVVGGIKALEPGYRSILIQPLPGGSVTSASTYTITPYGKVSVKWTLTNGTMEIDMEIPVNTSAVLRLGSPHIEDEVVGSGYHSRQVAYLAPGVWPPPFPPAREGEKPKEHVTLAE